MRLGFYGKIHIIDLTFLVLQAWLITRPPTEKLNAMRYSDTILKYFIQKALLQADIVYIKHLFQLQSFLSVLL